MFCGGVQIREGGSKSASGYGPGGVQIRCDTRPTIFDRLVDIRVCFCTGFLCLARFGVTIFVSLRSTDWRTLHDFYIICIFRQNGEKVKGHFVTLNEVSMHLITSVVHDVYLTIRLRARVFYEQIVNEAQPS